MKKPPGGRFFVPERSQPNDPLRDELCLDYRIILKSSVGRGGVCACGGTGQDATTLAQDLIEIVKALAEDQPLAERHHDHALTGDWKDHRDCHIKPDLIFIYRNPDASRLQLVRLGSHSELRL